MVATVCDQMSSNRTAINALMRDTEAKYHRTGEDKRTLGFEINGKEIVALYDPPHLLKQITNHLMENNAHFKAKTGEDCFMVRHNKIVRVGRRKRFHKNV